MDQNERRIIDDLFERLRKAEEQAGPRDPDAEALIGRHAAAQPAAPYYMAQAIVVQQEALARAQARIQELEAGRRAPFRRLPLGAVRRRRDQDARAGPRCSEPGRLRPLPAGGRRRRLPRRCDADGAWRRRRLPGRGRDLGAVCADEAAAAVPEAAPEHDPALAEEDPFGGEDLSGDAGGGDFDFDAFLDLNPGAAGRAPPRRSA